MLLEQDKQLLGQKLREQGLISAEDLAKALEEADKSGVSLPRYLVQAGLVGKSKVYETLAEIYGVPYVDISTFQIAQDAIEAIPAELAHRYHAIPLFKIGDTLNVAMENPNDVMALDHLSRRCQYTIDPCLGSEEDIEQALKEYFGAASSISELLQALSQERKEGNRPGLKKPPTVAKSFLGGLGLDDAGMTEYPVVQLVDLIFRQAYEERASDIHIEPEEKMLRIRYRVDGVLHEAATPPKELESEIISRIKVLAEMDIAETRVPQDGRIKMKIHDHEVDMRVSSMPTIHGENLVIRILKDSHDILDLSSLGMSKEMQEIFEGLVHRPYGMILETGPTGSGKTTTLYAALSRINSVERNIVTIEDPVECKLPLIRQIPINPKAGFDFANALRSILRQDPDVIMVGEMRDQETVNIAIQAALTGHLVFSTLHANSAAAVVTRLLDMKIEPFLIASSVIGVVSQRLVRKICDRCKVPDRPADLHLKALKLEVEEGVSFFKGKGCRHCHHAGYKGRVGIFEILEINEAIQRKIMEKATALEIEQEARKAGLKSLRQDALDKIRQGITTAEEVLKVMGAEQ